MKITTYIYSLVILLFSALNLSAENETDLKLKQSWRWHEFSQTGGLPSNRVLQLVETNSGTMFVLTDKGFAWYNGYYWHKVNTKLDIKYSSLPALQKDLDSGLTFDLNSKIYRVTKSGIAQIEVRLDTANHSYSLPFFYLKNIFFINKMDKRYKTFTPVVIENGIEKSLATFCNFNEVKNGKLLGYFASNNSVFLVTNNNLYYFNGITSIKVFPNDLPKMWIPSLYSTSQGITYIIVGYPAAMKSIWRYNPSTNTVTETNINHEIFLAASADKQDNFYFTMKNGDVAYYDNKANYTNLGYLNQYINEARFLIFDKKGNLWVASDDRVYLCNLNERRWNYNEELKELSNTSVNQILRSKFDSTLWIAAGDGVYNIKNNKVIKSFKKIGNTELRGITALQEDSKGRIWIGSGSLFDYPYYYENGKWTLFGADNKFPATGIHNIRKDKKGRLWFLTISRSSFGVGSGAICVDDMKVVQKYDETNGLNNSRVYNFLEDSKGAYWFASFRGLQKLKNGNWTSWSAKNENNLQAVYAIAEDAEGKIWFGGDRGSVRYVFNDKIYSPTIFNEKINIVHSLFLDNKNRLWILGRGLFLYSNDDKELLLSYTKNAGYKGNFAWPMLIEKDSILIGSFGNGYTTMYLNYNTDKFPKVIVTDQIQKGDNFEFKLIATSYYNRQNSEDILVRYKIDNNKWSEWSTLRQINAEHLSYGKHRITLQAANFFGEVDKNIKSIEFTVVAPFYLQPNYFVPIFILLVILIWTSYNNFKRKKEARQEIVALNLSLENKVAEQTAELTQAYENLQLLQYQTSDALEEEKMLNEMKSAFISSVSHEYRTPLTIILSSTYLIEKFVENNKMDRIIDTLHKIRASVATLTKFVDDSLTMKTPNKDSEGFKAEEFSLNRLITNVLEEIPNKDPLVKIIYPLNVEHKLNTSYLMLKNIIGAVISNSIKFNKNHNTINIEFDSNDEQIIIRVIDRGIGMTQEDIDNMFTAFYRSKNVIGLIEGTGLGLSIAKRSADEIGARIECVSQLNEGTTFTIVLPK